MKVKLKADVNSARGNWRSGDEYECGADEAQQLVDGGYATVIKDDVIETAVAKPAPQPARKKTSPKKAIRKKR